MRRLVIVVLVFVGCASETGIILVIDSNPQLPAPREIVVMVGSPTESDAFTDEGSDRFELDADRDLVKDPLRYLIRDNIESPIRVAVAGLGAELAEPLTAIYPDALEFSSGVVLEVALTLDQRADEDFDECGRCFTKGETFRISSQFDGDCDGSRPSRSDPAECAGRQAFEPDDCDDGDADRNPFALETCDGVDTDCDGRNEDYPIACFIDDLDSCLLGGSTCSESAGFSACEPGEGDPTAVPVELCASLGECASSEDPVDCYAEILAASGRLEQRTCQIEIAARSDGALRLCSGGQLLATNPECIEMVVLAVEGPPAAAASITAGTDAALTIGQRILCGVEPVSINLGGERTLDRAARLMVLELGEVDGAVSGHLIDLAPKYVEACGAEVQPLDCF